MIRALCTDPALTQISGKTLIGAELAVKYGITDEGGRQPLSYPDTHKVVPHKHHSVLIR